MDCSQLWKINVSKLVSTRPQKLKLPIPFNQLTPGRGDGSNPDRFKPRLDKSLKDKEQKDKEKREK
jgi:hypothetical protein